MKTTTTILAAAILIGTPLLAQAQPRGRDSRDNDDRRTSIGVARVTAITGDVSKRHGEGNELSRADAGTPLVSGDWVRTGVASRAELRLDNSNFVRMGPDSEVRLLQLGERSFQIDVIRGSASYTMLKHGEADVDLRTPNGNIVPQKDGVYRVEVPEPTRSRLVVRKGEAEVLTPAGSAIVKKGKTVSLEDTDKSVRQQVASAPSKDGFDQWNERRNKIVEQARGPVYSRGWYPSRIHLGLGWGWGPYWGPWGWGGYGWGRGYGWGGFGYSRPLLGYSRIGRGRRH
ncbi:MAG: FecR domain-containing protein [Bryobacteraceae bacterium]